MKSTLSLSLSRSFCCHHPSLPRFHFADLFSTNIILYSFHLHPLHNAISATCGGCTHSHTHTHLHLPFPFRFPAAWTYSTWWVFGTNYSFLYIIAWVQEGGYRWFPGIYCTALHRGCDGDCTEVSPEIPFPLAATASAPIYIPNNMPPPAVLPFPSVLSPFRFAFSLLSSFFCSIFCSLLLLSASYFRRISPNSDPILREISLLRNTSLPRFPFPHRPGLRRSRTPAVWVRIRRWFVACSCPYQCQFSFHVRHGISCMRCPASYFRQHFKTLSHFTVRSASSVTLVFPGHPVPHRSGLRRTHTRYRQEVRKQPGLLTGLNERKVSLSYQKCSSASADTLAVFSLRDSSEYTRVSTYT